MLVERRVRQPLVDLGLVVARPFLNANVCVAAFGLSFFGVLLLPQIAGAPAASGYGLGLSTIGIGLVVAPYGIAGLFSGVAGGRIVDRAGPRLLVAVGAALGIAAYVSLDTQIELMAGGAVLGLGLGFILTGIYSVVIRSAGVDKTGVAVAVNVVVRNTALAVGAQVAVAIVSGAGLVGHFQADSGYTRAFAVGAAGAGVLLLASVLLPGRASRTTRALDA